MSYRFDNAEIADLSRGTARDYNTEFRPVPAKGGCHQHHWLATRRGALVCCGCDTTIDADEL
jgi:hypothetical protein